MISAEVSQAIVLKFRRRARNLKISAALSLMLVLVAIGGGMYLFVFAGQIAAREANVTLDRLSRGVGLISDFVDQTQPEIRGLLDIYADVGSSAEALLGAQQRMLENLSQPIQLNINGAIDAETESDLRDAIEEWRMITTDVSQEFGPILSEVSAIAAVSNATMSDLKEITAETATFMRTLNEDLPAKITEIFGDVLETAANQTEEVQTTLLVSTLSTRIGAMLLIIFLVQILVNLYRYSIRLSGFYEARADAFEIIAVEDDVDLSELIRTLSPDNLDFGKSPQSPAEHAITLAREVIARQRG